MMKLMDKKDLVAVLIFVCAAAFVSMSFARGETLIFWRNLKLGDQGSDVLLLQKLLNLDKETQVSVSGPGSPGQETSFFGSKTASAVMRLQEKFASEILSPSGLASGTGFVGPATRKKLDLLAQKIAGQPTATSSPTPSTPDSKPPPMAVVSNAENLDLFLGEVRRVETKAGKNSSDIDSVIQALRQSALSSKINFRAKLAADIAQANANAKPALPYTFPKLLNFLKPFLTRAYAQTGKPFGGMLVYAFPCTCSATTLVAIAGSTGGLFDYVYGTQAYLSYTAPYATWWLGIETPGAGNTCYIYYGYGCTQIPSDGLITPTVGTSGL